MKIRKELFCSILNRLRGQYELEVKLEKEVREYREKVETDEFPTPSAFSGIFSDDNLEMLVELIDEIYRYGFSKLLVLGVRVWQEI